MFTATIAADLKPGQAVYFPTVQQCEKGVHRWIEVPGAGSTGRSQGGAGADHGEPAPVLRIMAPTRQH